MILNFFNDFQILAILKSQKCIQKFDIMQDPRNIYSESEISSTEYNKL